MKSLLCNSKIETAPSRKVLCKKRNYSEYIMITPLECNTHTLATSRLDQFLKDESK